MQIPELLAPGGSLEAAKAVIDAGANAVYTGLSRFSARAYAVNLQEEELTELLHYAHLHGASVHLTLNTLIKNREMEEALMLLKTPYEEGLDAVILQDHGLFSVVKKAYPGLSLHASTQMNLCSAGGARFLKERGAERVVLGRELSLEEISAIKREAEVEVEVFCHGALCCSYSGTCLLSAALGGRSANRGRCAGPCRLPYEAFGKKGYPFSLKDLCTIRHLPEIARAGADSLKIEGRHKSKEYAVRVTEVYRKYLDRLKEEGPDGYTVDEKDIEALLQSGNRNGFTDRYLFVHNDASMNSGDSPSYEVQMENLPAKKNDGVPVEGTWTVKRGERISFVLKCNDTEAKAEGDIPSEAKKEPLRESVLREKTGTLGDTAFTLQNLTVELEDGLFIPLSVIKGLKREAAAALEKKLLAPFRREGKEFFVEQPTLTPYEWIEPFFTAFCSKEEQLPLLLAENKLRRIYLSFLCFSRAEQALKLPEAFEKIRRSGMEAYFALPPVLRKNDIDYYRTLFQTKENLPDGFLVASCDGIGFVKALDFPAENVVLDQGLYVWSDYTKAAFEALGFCYDTVPAELKQAEIMHRENGGSELVIYGRQALMHTANCIWKNKGKCKKEYPSTTITDRKQEKLYVRAACDECMNILYNGHCVSLLPELPELKKERFRSFRYTFTFESAEEVEAVLKNAPPKDALLTKGLYKRGVE